MSTIVSDCPRCATRQVTFTVRANVLLKTNHDPVQLSEALCECAVCKRCSTAVLARRRYRYIEATQIARNDALWGRDNELSALEGDLSNALKSIRFVAGPPRPRSVPDAVPDRLKQVQAEANQCLAMECWNAAGALYCAVLDLVTAEALSGTRGWRANKANRQLWTRLAYLFDHDYLPRDLRLLADCVPRDREGFWFNAVDAADLSDFATELLHRKYSQPDRIRRALARREERAAG